MTRGLGDVSRKALLYEARARLPRKRPAQFPSDCLSGGWGCLQGKSDWKGLSQDCFKIEVIKISTSHRVCKRFEVHVLLLGHQVHGPRSVLHFPAWFFSHFREALWSSSCEKWEDCFILLYFWKLLLSNECKPKIVIFLLGGSHNALGEARGENGVHSPGLVPGALVLQ